METEPVSNIESETKPSDAKSVVMAPIKFKCTVGGCSFETDELKQTVAAQVLGIHSEANHVKEDLRRQTSRIGQHLRPLHTVYRGSMRTECILR